ncbi:hypothetical protein QR680_006154 [Steinernema hermaphroditum]|uniref:Probable DNA-directed RNA polymerase II subunit RPB11 n=1 Tax=Steinernema hermaphroditum TaxID=289476 RepID=A0AA39LWY0_9BILA|nr:hypothetical protein QR680_006154 [Steinernema hermaphroditum]
MNAPQAFESFILFPGEERISYQKDTKVPNAALFTIMKEDHTIGNMIKHQLLENKEVLFAGYRVPHPLEHRVEMRVQTTQNTTPVKAFIQALRELQEEVRSLKKQFVMEMETTEAMKMEATEATKMEATNMHKVEVWPKYEPTDEGIDRLDHFLDNKQ